jgi:hypothetical protein
MRFWLVYCRDSGDVFEHDFREKAVEHATNLARCNPGRSYTVLRAVGHSVVTLPSPVWSEYI